MEYRLTDYALAALRDRLKPLRQRGLRLGLPEERLPRIEVIRSERVPLSRRPESTALVHTVVLGGEAPRLRGWRLAAWIRHLAAGEDGQPPGNILHVAPDAPPIPQQYRAAPPRCDHCGVLRRRNDTYLLVSEDGSLLKQVGRDCLQDFVGEQSPEALVAWFEFLSACETGLEQGVVESGKELHDLDNDDEGGVGQFVRAERWLAWVALSIRERGWVSRARGESSGRMSTADAALYDMERPRVVNGRRVCPTDEDCATARAALAWGRALEAREDLTDYEHNLLVISRLDSLPRHLLAMAATLVPAMQRDIERQAQAATSRHVGRVGERIEIEARVVSRSPIEGRFGLLVVIRLTDRAGNALVWFASGGPPLKEGAWCRLRATVKAHEEYKGVKQTVLTRCAVVEELAAPAEPPPASGIAL